jgi:hypothetical protein
VLAKDRREPLAAGKREFLASREPGKGEGRGPVAASILRLGSARGSDPGDTLVGIRVGECGGCGVYLHADSAGTVAAATVTRKGADSR